MTDSAKNPPNLNNMGGLNPHNMKNPLFWVGFDWLTLNYSIDWSEKWESDAFAPKNWEGEGSIPVEQSAEKYSGLSLRSKLLDCLSLAQETGEPVEVPEWGAKVHPGGGKIGGKKYCKFKIERPDAVILIADSPKYKGDWPNVKVEISGERCLVYPGGAEAAYISAVNWLESLGAKIHKERVSRADLCADFPGLEMGIFHDAYKADWWACRANRHHPDISNGVSLYFGAGAVTLRVYDKMAEMQASALRGKPAKYEHMVQKRWGGKEPTGAVRVEYQLRREWLKLHGADTVDDLLRLSPDFVGYLTGAANERWFRFLCAPQDNKHPERNHTLPEWEAVQTAFKEVFRYPEKLINIDPDRANIETLLKQSLGVLETAAANKGFDLPWKETAAPIKYKMPCYEDFEEWLLIMLRSVAINKKEWNFREKPEEKKMNEEYELFLARFVDKQQKENKK